MNLKGKSITVHDMTLRDGMHPKRHQMSLEQMKSIACALDDAGVPLIEVTHGDGLGGSSVNYGFPAHTDEEYLGAVIPLMKRAKVSALLLPGIGTVDHLMMAHDIGVNTIRVATHCTEADVSEQHIAKSRALGLDTVGFLMMAHMNTPEGLVSQAKLMEGYGANCIYVTDSAGYMLPEDVTPRIEAVRAALKPETELGFHGHHNLAMGITPRSVKKDVKELIDGVASAQDDKSKVRGLVEAAEVEAMSEKDLAKRMKLLEKQMLEHARNLEFEKAARVRDQLAVLREQAFGAAGGDNVLPLLA